MPTRKLTDDDELALIEAYRHWEPSEHTESADDVAARFDVTRQTLYRVLRKHREPLKASVPGAGSPNILWGIELDRQRDELAQLREDLHQLRKEQAEYRRGIRDSITLVAERLGRLTDRLDEKVTEGHDAKHLLQEQFDMLGRKVDLMSEAGQVSGAHLMTQLDKLAEHCGVDVDPPEEWIGELSINKT